MCGCHQQKGIALDGGGEYFRMSMGAEAKYAVTEQGHYMHGDGYVDVGTYVGVFPQYHEHEEAIEDIDI